MSNEELNAAASCVGNLSFNGPQRRLDGKVAIITGGATGIGEAIVWLFAKHGARVIIADIAEEGGRKLAGSLSPPATYVHCDVSNEKDIRAAVDLAMEKYGQLDIMYNNAGTVESVAVDSVTEYKMEQFDRVMRVNVRGVMLGIKHAARVMIPRKKGCIISTASVAGIVAGMSTHAYTASKHAVIGLTKNGAAELGKYGIRVNAVSPYGVATALAVNYMKQGNASVVSEEDKAAMEAFCNSTANLEGATLKAEDVAEAGLYLASDEAKYVSGHNLVVDGGFSVVNHSWKLYR